MKRLSRRRSAPTKAAEASEPEVPCIPCAQKRGVRQFSLNAPEPSLVIEGDAVPRLTPEVAFTIVDGAVVLYQTQLGVSHVLNASAALIWASIDDVATVTEIIDDLHTTADVERAVIASDVQHTLSSFVAAGIATFEHDSDPPVPASTPRWSSLVEGILDERAWSTILSPVIASSASLTVRTNNTELGHALETLLAPLVGIENRNVVVADTLSVVDSAKDGPRRFRLYLNGSKLSSWPDLAALPSIVLSEINKVAIERPEGRLLLHAGAVERDGRVIVIAGDSGQGKSTLTAALLQRGYSYVTDELVAIDPSNLDVLRFPKPLSLDRTSLDLLDIDEPAASGPSGKGDIDPARFGQISQGGRLSLIVLLNPAPEAALQAAITSPVTSLLELLSCTFLSSFEHPTALDELAALAGRVRVLTVERGDLAVTCSTVDAEFTALSGA